MKSFWYKFKLWIIAAFSIPIVLAASVLIPNKPNLVALSDRIPLEKNTDNRESLGLGIIVDSALPSDAAYLNHRIIELYGTAKTRGKSDISGDFDFNEILFVKNGIEYHLRLYFALAKDIDAIRSRVYDLILPGSKIIWFEDQVTDDYMRKRLLQMMKEDGINRVYVGSFKEVIPSNLNSFTVIHYENL